MRRFERYISPISVLWVLVKNTNHSLLKKTTSLIQIIYQKMIPEVEHIKVVLLGLKVFWI